ncbi:hypothetical protein FHU35_111484 [Saccharopolyspora dendranthemae]|uniref:Uncharacterized protein n=1 Tax=Saccharopolyspora dendranthemae TaxID=1181886 RepID=A0A561VBD6_9PSEU|nr:hypothetical protein FHU35_111484 [Saccharopolyspora dendranthemae]
MNTSPILDKKTHLPDHRGCMKLSCKKEVRRG